MGWTPERKAQQSKAIQRWKPWEKSTGPKTAKGKAASSKNSFRNGQSRNLRRLAKELNALMRKQQEMLKRV